MSSFHEPVARMLNGGLLGPPPRPGTLGAVDGYEVLEMLGAGGMGIVFLAQNTATGQEVAIKFARPEFSANEGARERFILEARHQQKLKHPAIVPVLDARETGQGAFFVMPLFPSGSLAQVLRSGKPLTRDRILQWVIPVAEALGFAHSKGIIHRDIKPGNILLDGNGSALVGDFGLARSLFNDPTLDVERENCEGTAPYMSPQVARGEAEDTRCDIYAVGALLYEMLTGVPPYKGQNNREIREQILAGPPRKIRERAPKADSDLAQIAEWAMAAEHRDRYASMNDLLADLRRVEAGKAPTGPHRQWSPSRFLRRVASRVWPALVAVIVLWGAWVFWPRTELVLWRSLSPDVEKGGSVHLAEFNGVPGKELLVFNHGDSSLVSYHANGEYVSHWPAVKNSLPLSWVFISPAEVAQRDNLLVSWWTNDLYGISVLNGSLIEVGNRFVVKGVAPHRRVKAAAGYLITLGRLRFKPDGELKLITHLSLFNKEHADDYSRTREIICFDFASGAEEWRYAVGPHVAHMISQDLDGDGKLELIFGGNSAGNGYVAGPGRSDTNACVFAVSAERDELWYTNLAGLYSVATPFKAKAKGLNPSAIPVLVTVDALKHRRPAPSGSKLLLLNSRGEVTAQYAPGPCLLSHLALDVDGDGWEEILISDCEGQIHVLNGNLEVPLRVERILAPAAYREGTVDHAILTLVSAGRFKPGGGVQILAHYALHRQDTDTNPGIVTQERDPHWQDELSFCLISSRLKLLVRHKMPWKVGGTVQAADMDGDGFEDIVMSKDHVEIFKVR